MRRSDREIADRAGIEAILRGASVCRVAMIDGDEPYLVPFSFGFDGGAIYIHTALDGRAVACFARGPRVCFEAERGVELVRGGETACAWSMAYESVIGYGRVEERTAPEAKAAGLNVIMRQYAGRAWTFDPAAMAKTRVWKIAIESMTGKRRPRG
jgi:nitroimidazol reductase NimA-like FMN-containing flavoprotein (pyridoxamine 5'-phosphate oxidase superfamily)